MIATPPPTPATIQRMYKARKRMCAALDIRLTSGNGDIWGWSGRTLGSPAIGAAGPLWLRIASARDDQPDNVFWSGAVDAKE